MLGVYFSVWVLALLDLQSSVSTCCIAGIFSTTAATWCNGAGYIGAGSVSGILGSTISIICGSWMSTSTPGILILSTSDGSTPGISIWSTSDGSNFGISTPPIGRPCLLVKPNFSIYSLPRALTWVITVSGIGIKSQLRQTILSFVLSDINLKPPCRFPLVPS